MALSLSKQIPTTIKKVCRLYLFLYYALGNTSPVPEFIDPCFCENKPKTLVFSHWKRAFWACFHENWVYNFGHRSLPFFKFKSSPLLFYCFHYVLSLSTISPFPPPLLAFSYISNHISHFFLLSSSSFLQTPHTSHTHPLWRFDELFLQLLDFLKMLLAIFMIKMFICD